MNPWITFLAPPAILASASASCFAVQYLSVEQAQKVLFPEATEFVSRPVTLSPEQAAAIDEASGVRVRTPNQPVWEAHRGTQQVGWFIVDEVYGKHELITYAVALSNNGRVLGIEILNYRESYGYEIRNPAWRAQFVGKTTADTVKLEADIKNISGATMSCRHVSEGVRRLLALHEFVLL
ncbi:MAG: FMN-binding protein [Burkholderiales bacterium]